jgi:hypothetical protein
VGQLGPIDGDHAQARLAAAERLADRATGDQVEISVLALFVPVIMAGEDVADTVLVQELEVSGAGFTGNVEVLIGRVSGFQEQRNVEEDEDLGRPPWPCRAPV